MQRLKKYGKRWKKAFFQLGESIRNLKINILVKRSGALGDVLCVTPITARLRREYPDAKIIVHTSYIDVFKENPHINGMNTAIDWSDRNWAINLDMAHESRRNLHAIEAYMEVAFNDHGDQGDKSILFKYEDLQASTPEKLATIHPNKSWPNRTMPDKWWDDVSLGMNDAGYTVACLGTNIDYCPAGDVIDTRGKLNLKGQASLIAASNVFICGASGLFILAAATETPVVVPLTINTPETCLPWRHGIQGFNYFPILADVPCLGCSAEQGPVTSMGCESPRKDPNLPDYACINTIKASKAVELALMAAPN